MTALQVKNVTTDDGARLAVYVREPSADPSGTVVLGHGWILDHRSWLPVVDRLDPSLRVVLWDQRGHGRSTLAGGGHKVGDESIKRLGRDLSAVIGATVPDGEKVVLGGHSMGGMTIMAYAGVAPDEFAERVRGVALVSTAAGGLRGTGRAGEAGLMAALRHVPFRLGRAMTEKGQRRTAFGKGARPEDVRDATRIVRGTRASVLGGFYGALMKHDEIASLPALRSVPVRILVGTRDLLTPHKLGDRLAQELPDAELTKFDGLGHMLTWEASDDVATAITTLAR
ncbi:alpha/beta hydrolase [Flexivirga sp. ID2601S]|uniref:Alpha/beta hydrolase n=1 Tax=Flexivirga aerilata TaxID=1656889 RepID=A0A849AHU0_9MICO|nr:alpha/beta hydrolase [Flexivirga aerilata]NNG38768.1 alpha/beta hydrolase [Flexivirga aerilata]